MLSLLLLGLIGGCFADVSHVVESNYQYDAEDSNDAKDDEIVKIDGRPTYVDYDDDIVGKAGRDYPNYNDVPKTNFTCEGKTVVGFYADVEAYCQVFHICIKHNEKQSFLCPKGTVFNQKVLVCDWWYKVDCQSTDYYINLINDILKVENQEYYHENYENDLNLAQSGGSDDLENSKGAKQNR